MIPTSCEICKKNGLNTTCRCMICYIINHAEKNTKTSHTPIGHKQMLADVTNDMVKDVKLCASTKGLSFWQARVGVFTVMNVKSGFNLMSGTFFVCRDFVTNYAE